MENYVKISSEVLSAIKAHKPVVALESTIISHGMPYPENVKTALQCEQVIREEGCIPATIAILNGVIIVGLNRDEIEVLGKNGEDVIKTSRRDIPYVLSQKKNGAMTVSGTMIASEMAGIKFFATGGIGGVHRGAEITMDISADLEELAKTSVCVICAGVKSILDLPKTLEYLETKGIPVVGYQTNRLPGFFTSSSPYPVNFRLDTPEAIANLAKAKWNLHLQGGIIVANPVPKESSYDSKTIDQAIEKALSDMKDLGYVGKDTTPYLLKRISELTGGKSLESNIALVLNNCRLAAKIAKAYYTTED
jgi:pseudouridine-5'-phosphate glycosidase